MAGSWPETVPCRLAARGVAHTARRRPATYSPQCGFFGLQLGGDRTEFFAQPPPPRPRLRWLKNHSRAGSIAATASQSACVPCDAGTYQGASRATGWQGCECMGRNLTTGAGPGPRID